MMGNTFVFMDHISKASVEIPLVVVKLTLASQSRGNYSGVGLCIEH